MTLLLEHPPGHPGRAFAIVGILAVLLSVPLVATSSAAAIRWLGRQRWQRLHRLTYVIAAAVIAHLWLVRQDDGPAGNIVATIVFGGAMVVRLPRVRAAITRRRRELGGSLLAARTWLVPVVVS